MKKIEKVIFSEEDMNLLREKLPDSPCDKCSLANDGSCCGCPKGREYESIVKPYREKGILKYALKLKSRYMLTRELNNIHSAISKIVNNLPDQLKTIYWDV